MYNQITLVGRIGQEPKLDHTQGGTAKLTFSLATTEKWKDRQSAESKEKTTWHNIIMWGKSGEALSRYLTKGQQVMVVGAQHYNEYTDKNGEDKKFPQVTARDIKMLSKGKDPQQAPQRAAPPQQADFDDDDIPF